MERKVNVTYLKTGMYVSNLDRPWLDTPFILEGFTIANEDDILTLQKYCTYVYIDKNGALQQQTAKPTRQDWSRKIFTMQCSDF